MASQQPPPTTPPQPALSQPAAPQLPPQQPVPAPIQQPVQPPPPPPTPAAVTPLDPHAESLYVGGTNREIVCRHPHHGSNYTYFTEGQELQWETHYRNSHLGKHNHLQGYRAYCGYCSHTSVGIKALKKHIRDCHNTRSQLTLGRQPRPSAVPRREIGRQGWATQV